jgi:hypothetical protein
MAFRLTQISLISPACRPTEGWLAIVKDDDVKRWTPMALLTRSNPFFFARRNELLRYVRNDVVEIAVAV